MSLSARYLRIQEEVAKECQTAGRDPRAVRIVAVSKTVGSETIAQASACGIHDFGENRPDSLKEKQDRYPCETWHFIGNIQSRRIKDIVASAQWIHSLYHIHHLPLIESAACEREKIQKVLLEVNVLGEASKGGIAPQAVSDFLEESKGYPHICVQGFMTMAPQGDLVQARECFNALADLRNAMRTRFSDCEVGDNLHELSMGMSEDWREAVAAGATMVRIGRALFDEAHHT